VCVGEWKEILNVVQDVEYQNVVQDLIYQEIIQDVVQDLSYQGIIDKIKKELGVKYSNIYREWENTEFNIDYPFPFHSRNIENQCTLLHISAFHGAGIIVDVLLENGASVNARDGYGRTPLHQAVISDDAAIVEAILAKGADINAVDQGGDTPLHHAIEDNRKHVVKALLNKGADLSLKNNYGRTPKDLIWDQEREQFFGNVGERQLLQSKVIISGTVGFVTAVLQAVIAMWLVKEGSIDIRKMPMVLMFITMVALAVGITAYKVLDNTLHIEPSTRVEGAQTIREEEADTGVVVSACIA
jgi:hypothetical protein